MHTNFVTIWVCFVHNNAFLWPHTLNPYPASLSLTNLSHPASISPLPLPHFSTDHPSPLCLSLSLLLLFFVSRFASPQSPFLSRCLSPWCGVSGWGATLSDSNCTDVNDILLMLSATSDTGAQRGHSAAQTQGCSQTMYRNSLTVKLEWETMRRRERKRSSKEEKEGERRAREEGQLLWHWV